MKIRIVSPGFETFTGPLAGGTMFEDGLSVGDVDRRLVMRIGAALSVVEVDDEGNELGQVGPAATLFNIRGDDMPNKTQAETGVESALRLQAAAEQDAKRKQEEAERVEAEKAALQSAREKLASETPVIYTRLELEGIGANEGINGLRNIAAKMENVKGRSVSELVAAILKAQTKALAS